MILKHATRTFILRLVPALTIIFLELLLLSVLVDARTLQQYSSLSILLSESGNIVRWIIVSVGIFALLIASDFRPRVAPLAQPLPWQSWGTALVSHIVLFLGLFYDDILYDFNLNKVGLEEFWVFVDASCSGIEGMVLAAATTAIYLFLSRRYLKFPHALLLIPLACVISVALNIVRIFTLIIIGAKWSPALAIGGFHSVAGWIAAVLVALLIVFIFSSWSWIQQEVEKSPIANQDSSDSNLAEAVLVPFVIFLGVTLVAQIFADGFDFIYPIKVIAASAALLA